MATGKRFYWMKLKESFMTSDTIDYFMSQPDGANYVVLYQMLCLKTINTQGRLSRQIGEIIIPYDIDKIVRDCKWFSADTVRVALRLYKAFGLIYEDVDGVLVMSDHNALVGSESDYAEQKRVQRESKPKQIAEKSVDNVQDNISKSVHTDIRDRDKRLEIEKEKESKEKSKEKGRFAPPSRDDVRAYARERNSDVDPDRFFDYFDAGNWIDSKGQPVRNWKQKFITWENQGAKNSGKGETRNAGNGSNGNTTEDGYAKWGIKPVPLSPD